jgi:hypothetical protein
MITFICQFQLSIEGASIHCFGEKYFQTFQHVITSTFNSYKYTQHLDFFNPKVQIYFFHSLWIA